MESEIKKRSEIGPTEKDYLSPTMIDRKSEKCQKMGNQKRGNLRMIDKGSEMVRS